MNINNRNLYEIYDSVGKWFFTWYLLTVITGNEKYLLCTWEDIFLILCLAITETCKKVRIFFLRP